MLPFQPAILVILRHVSACEQRRDLSENKEEGFPQLAFLWCQLLHFHPDPKQGTKLGSSGKERWAEGLDQVMLMWSVNVAFPCLGFNPRFQSRPPDHGALAQVPPPGQPLPKAAHPNSAHFDPWRSVGGPMFSFLLTLPPVSPIRPLQADTAHIHAQLQASTLEKNSQP